MNTKQEPWTRAEWIGAFLLCAATFIAYQQAWHAGFVWDDDAHVTRPGLRDFHGLLRIWFEPGATQQYYPVLYSAFWLEHLAWGDSPTGYHLANILIHAIAACLFYRVLRRLDLPGAAFAAAAFALHPINVESVAWISEQKNTLSAVFYFSAALVYLRYDEERSPSLYFTGGALFVLALLTKSVTATLPAALLVILWWRRGRLSLTRDVLPLVPWLILGAGTGAMTAWMERTHVGASGQAFALGFGGRLIVAGHALWFYLGKIFWPSRLTFIYPRWTISSGNLLAYGYLAAAAAVFIGFWAIRRRSRAPLAAALLFAGTLFPALGFINVFPFLYSFVADHFQYLAGAVVMAAMAAAASLGAQSLTVGRRFAAGIAGCGIIAALAIMTWRQCADYESPAKLWRATLQRNPSCWMAYNNLAAEFLQEGRVDDAAATAQLAIKFAPDNAAAHATAGEALGRQGRLNEAYAEFGRALEIEPYNVAAQIDLGAGLLQTGRFKEAIDHYRSALKADPDSAKAHSGLGDAYLRTRRVDEALLQYATALEDDPDDATVHANLGTALMQKGRAEEARVHYQKAVDLDPGFTTAQFNLGNILLQTGHVTDAVAHYRKAVEIDPGFIAAHTNFAYALMMAGRTDEAARELQKVVDLDPTNVSARKSLADLLARKGR
jgi:protein O-mannosyl-transferase